MDDRVKIAIKAVGDWELDVLAVPFGGPDGGKDSHGEYFSQKTNLHLDKFPKPMIQYYHGYDPDGLPQGEPVEIGTAKSYEIRPDGVWFRVILDKTKEYAQRVMDAARKGFAYASSGSISHLVRVAKDGLIENWPLVEFSIFDNPDNQRPPANSYAVALLAAKAIYESAGIDFPEIEPVQDVSEAEAIGEQQRADAVPENGEAKKSQQEKRDMEHDEVTKLVAEETAKAVSAALKADREAQAAQAEAKKVEDEKIASAVKAEKEKWEAEAAKANRLPWRDERGQVVNAKFGDLNKYDNLDAGDQAVLVGVLNAKDGHSGNSYNRASEGAIKALAIKLTEDKSGVGVIGQRAMKAAGIKTDEVMHSDLTSYGDDWVGQAYSQSLWENIRQETWVLNQLPAIEVPQGMETITIPLESGDPTFYKVAETEDHDSTMLFPVASVTASQAGTTSKTLSLAKMGARVSWSGEMVENSLIPFVSQIRAQLVKAGHEQLEHALIDGDTATAATTNINDIGNSSTQTATNLYLLLDGFRKSCLVTTTANSRDGGVLTVDDFLETVKLMGTAGINALDITKIGFIMDVNTHWKALQLPEVKTRDVNTQATVENGKLTRIYGYPVHTSVNMHYKSAARKANSSGKVDQDTTTNNTKGALLAVRWDQWLVGWRRRMTIETTRYPRSDSSEIVMLSRLGLAQRDTEASAISYNLTV